MVHRLWALLKRYPSRTFIGAGLFVLMACAIHRYIILEWRDDRKREGTEIKAADIALEAGRIGAGVGGALITAGLLLLIRTKNGPPRPPSD